MTCKMILSLGLVLIPLQAFADDRPIRFKSDIAPILVKNCLGCHNDLKAKNGLNMSTYALLRKGGKGSGEEVVIPGDAENSELVASLRADAEPRHAL